MANCEKKFLGVDDDNLCYEEAIIYPTSGKHGIYGLSCCFHRFKTFQWRISPSIEAE